MRWIAVALFAIGLWCCAQAQVPMTGAGLGVPPAASSSVIKMIQPGSCTIASSAATCTYTISPAISNTANAILIWNGSNTTSTLTGTDFRDAASIAITNSTTITATRGAATVTTTLLVNFTIIEFASGVNSVQAGTITVAAAGGATNTATISSVGANSFVIFQGCNISLTTANTLPQCSVALTNSTTVTATVAANATATQVVGYMVADLGTSIVSAAPQPKAVSITTANVSDNDTLGTAVTLANTLLIYGGVSSQNSATFAFDAYTTALTGTTTVTKTRSGSSTNARIINYTAVPFAAAALNGSVQRGTIALAAATSNTATISPVTLAKSFVNWCGFLAGNVNPNVAISNLVLTNGTTVTAAVNAAGSPTVSYEVMQFN